MRQKGINVLIILIILFATGIYRWYENFFNETQPNESISGWHSQALPFLLENDTGSIVLHLSQFTQWLHKQTDLNRTTAIQNVVKRTLCQFHTFTSAKLLDINSCCNRFDSNGSIVGLNCTTSLGPMPPVTHLDPTQTQIPTDPPEYKHNMVYVDHPNELKPQSQFPCPVNLEKRKGVYDLLRHWIRLAEQHQLVWWLNHGSLLGAIRNGDFIPYDHDADISVLNSAEPTIRQLATGWQNLSFDKINLITREQDYCVQDHMPRLNCQGIPVRYQMDPCGFCTPLARLISSYFTFLDLFLVNIELRMDAQGNPVDMGILDEVVDRDRGVVLSYPLDRIFPLTTCNYMGLKLPCPRDSDVVLRHLYGENYMRPARLCNPQSGHWYNT